MLSKLRAVQAIVSHLANFPTERAEAAARRARHFECRSYVAIRNILRQGLDLEPLGQESKRWSRGSRFARPSRSTSTRSSAPATSAARMILTSTRNRRSADQIIQDHEAEIARIRAREATRAAKARPEAQPLILAVRALDKAGRVATEAGNREMTAAVDSARAALAPAIVGLGLRIPEKTKRGRKRKGEAA